VVCKSVGLSLRAVDLAEDLVGVLGPSEGARVVVPSIDERADRLCELARPADLHRRRPPGARGRRVAESFLSVMNVRSCAGSIRAQSITAI
jgi:hypothetical protein